MATEDKPTMPPPAPVELGFIVEELIQAEIEDRESGMFERLYIEQIYSENDRHLK